MDVQLQELIDKIKNDGVAEADEKAADIISKAEKRAETIIEDAKNEAKTIVRNAENEVSQMEAKAEESIRQSGRDLMLNVKKSVLQVFDELIKSEVKGNYSENVMEKVISLIIESWVEKGATEIEILLPENEKEIIEKYLMSRLSDEMKKGLEIKPYPQLQKGFRISEKNRDSYYDFSDEGIAECLVRHMNPKLGDMIMDLAGGE